jgi:hypothetical protein
VVKLYAVTTARLSFCRNCNLICLRHHVCTLAFPHNGLYWCDTDLLSSGRHSDWLTNILVVFVRKIEKCIKKYVAVFVLLVSQLLDMTWHDIRQLVVRVWLLVKGKDFPLQAWSGAWGFRRLRLLDRLDIRHYEGGKVVTLTHRPSLPQGVSRYSFLEAESTPGHMVPSVASEKIPSDTTGERSRDLPTSSAVP